MKQDQPNRAVKIGYTRLMAEFVIIVAGVLVALAVDSFVERMHERELTASYLERLETEVRKDSVVILGGIEFVDRADSALVELLALRRGVAPPDKARLIDGLMRARVSGVPGALSQNTLTSCVARAQFDSSETQEPGLR